MFKWKSVIIFTSDKYLFSKIGLFKYMKCGCFGCCLARCHSMFAQTSFVILCTGAELSKSVSSVFKGPKRVFRGPKSNIGGPLRVFRGSKNLQKSEKCFLKSKKGLKQLIGIKILLNGRKLLRAKYKKPLGQKKNVCPPLIVRV